MQTDCRPSPIEQVSQSISPERTYTQTNLPVAEIIPNPNQPRRRFSKGKLAELVLSIRTRGVLTPVRVRQLENSECYELIAGERRWRAAKEAGLEKMPAIIVRDQAPEQAQVDAYLENVVRENLNTLERASALIQLRVSLGSHSSAGTAVISLLPATESVVLSVQ